MRNYKDETKIKLKIIFIQFIFIEFITFQNRRKIIKTRQMNVQVIFIQFSP